MRKTAVLCGAAALAGAAFSASLLAQSQGITSKDILDGFANPARWLTNAGDYSGQRHSPLKQITPANAKDLEIKWVFQMDSTEKLESTPLVVDGVMYVTQPPNDIIALDAKTGRIFWIYQYRVAPDARVCCGRVNRGLGLLGDTLFMLRGYSCPEAARRCRTRPCRS